MTRGRLALETVQLRVVLDAIPAHIVLIDRERRHRYVNQEHAAFLGRAARSLLGQTVAEVIGVEAFNQIRSYGERALAGETVRWEGWLPYRGEPGLRFFQRIYMPYRGKGGVIEGYFVFARDLTELKRSEQRLADQLTSLQRSEALAAAVIAAALDCVVVIDEAGIVVEFNPAAERTFGYARTDVVGRPLAGLIMPPALQAAHTAGLQAYLQTGEAHLLGRRVEIAAMRSDGSVFPAELAITEVDLPERRLFTAYLRDLTPVRRAAAQIERQRAALRESQKLATLGSLLAGVAHELNNPLSIVTTNALMLEEEAQEGGGANLAERAGRVRSAAERCGRIVQSFLAIARQGRTRCRPVAPCDLVRPALELLEDGLRERGIGVACDVSPDLPPVLGDPDQLHQVLVNLIMNARQAVEGQKTPGRITMSARNLGASVEIMISDNGPGVAEAIRGRIFEPFFTTKPTGAGAGLGLAVSRGIAEAQGGSLRFVPVPEGACFILRLPVAPGAAVGVEAPSEPAQLPPGHI